MSRFNPNSEGDGVPHASNSAGSNAGMNGAAHGAMHGASANGARALPVALGQELAGGAASGEIATQGVPFYGAFGPGHHGDDGEVGGGFTLAQILGLIMRRWPLMLAAWLLTLAAGASYAYLSPAIYASGATIEINTSPQREIADDVPGVSQFLGNRTRSIDTQVEILRSPQLQERVGRGLSPATKQELQEFVSTNIEQVGMTSLLSITAQSHSPRAAQELANSIGKEFIAMSLEKNTDSTRQAIDYVKDQRAKKRKQLTDAQTSLKDFKEKTGIFNISEAGNSVGVQLGSIGASLGAAQAERAAATARLQALQQQVAKLSPSEAVPRVQQQPSAQVQAIQGRLTQLELERLNLTQTYLETSPKVRQKDGEIAGVRAELQNATRNQPQAFRANPAYPQVNQNLADTQSGIYALDARINALQSSLSSLKAKQAKLPQQELRFSILLQDVQTLQRTYDLLDTRNQQLELAVQARDADARLVFPAGLPGGPIAPNRPRILIYAFVLGLLLAFALAALFDLLDNRVHTDQDAERTTGLQVLAQIPLIREEKQQCLISADENSVMTSAQLESFGMLRLNIAFSGPDKPIRVLVVTSSVPNEGKSTTCANLAVAAALSGQRVVLIDCDLRRPTVHRLCGPNLHNKRGFTSVVSGTCTLEEALQETQISGLRVLTTGPTPHNPVKLLNSASARNLIQQVAQDTDFVIIDTPPALALADARIVATMADAALLVVSCKEAGRREIGRAAQLLLRTGTDVIGTVLTKVTGGLAGAYSYDPYYNQGSYLKSDGAKILRDPDYQDLPDGDAAQPEALTSPNGQAR